MYIQDCIDDWRDMFQPDIYSPTVDTGSDLWRGVGFQFGELIVSIQWSEYNYCDHYIGNSYFTFNPQPIYKGQYKKTRTAEVAIICKSRFDFRYDWVSRWFVLFDEYESVKAYAEVSEIEDILRVCRDYARA